MLQTREDRQKVFRDGQTSSYYIDNLFLSFVNCLLKSHVFSVPVDESPHCRLFQNPPAKQFRLLMYPWT